MIKPVRAPRVANWLAVPIGTSNEDATSTRTVLKKKVTLSARKTHKSNVGSNNALLKLLSVSNVSLPSKCPPPLIQLCFVFKKYIPFAVFLPRLKLSRIAGGIQILLLNLHYSMNMLLRMKSTVFQYLENGVNTVWERKKF